MLSKLTQLKRLDRLKFIFHIQKSKSSASQNMLILNIFIRFALVWVLTFLAFPLGVSYANSETKLKASRHYSDGIELSRANYWREATDEFLKTIQVDPKHKLAYANLGVALSQTEKHKEALLAFDEAIKLGYDHALLRYNRGLSLARLNRTEKAVKEIELSLKMNSRNVKAMFNLGLLYIKQNRPNEAQDQVNLLYTRNNKLAKKLFDTIPPKYKVVSVENGGSLKGRVRLVGEVPHPRFFPLISSPNIEYCARISDGKGHRILFDFTVSDSNGLKDTIIKLVDVHKGKTFSTEIQKLVMNRCHIPKYVIGIRNSETLILENTDPIRHEVATYEFSKRGVNQRSNRPVDGHTSQARDVYVEHTTEEFLIKCNLHPFLQTRAVMVDNPYYTVTDKEGKYSIQDIPPGTYIVSAWHPFIEKKLGSVTIKPGQPSKMDFDFDGEDARRKLYTNDLMGYRFQPVYDSNKNFYGGPRIDDAVEILQVYNKSKN